MPLPFAALETGTGTGTASATARGSAPAPASATGTARRRSGDAGPITATLDALRRKGSGGCSWTTGRWTGRGGPGGPRRPPAPRGGGRSRAPRGGRAGAADRFGGDRLPGRRRLGVRARARRRARGAPTRHVFSERFECRACAVPYELPQPRLFSFNNPFGACATCHASARDRARHGPRRADPTKSIAATPSAWSKPHYRSSLTELKRAARAAGCGSTSLDGPDGRGAPVRGPGRRGLRGIRGFFAWLERKKYKVHVRVFLSRYRGYLTCPACGGARPAAGGARRPVAGARSTRCAP